MTIWFSTNIPEMRAISAFNRVSTDIADIQQRITTGQRINSGRDDPGGLVIREGLRADIKGIQSAQTEANQAEMMLNVASNGMMRMLELLVGSDPGNPDNGGLIGVLRGSLGYTQKKEFGENFLKLYDGVVATAKYNNVALLDGKFDRKLNLGPGAGTLDIKMDTDFTTAAGTEAKALADKLAGITDETTLQEAITAAEALQKKIATELGTLGGHQNIVAMNQKLLDSRLTTLTAAEGSISNANIALESSRLARTELLAQNTMNSIMYNRRFAAFSVSSLFG